MRIGLIILTGVLAFASLSRGDVLYLTDGKTLEGDVGKSPDGWVVTDSAGKVTAVPAGKVQSIEMKSGGGKAAPDAAEAKLYSLRRSVANVGDLRDIIARYKRFIEQNPGPEVKDAAEKELAVWVDRQARGLVKAGSQWVTPQEHAALLEQTFAVVSEARQLIKDNRNKDADALLAKAMQLDPTNVSVQYLRGVVKYRQGEVPAARKAFEGVAEQMPAHASTLNNLAVILSRQNQHAAALGMYDRAMQAAPNLREVLDNVAEALNGAPDDARRAQVLQRAMKRFLEQDEHLRAEMAKRGLSRWGATWVSQEQKEELDAAERNIKVRLDQLAAEFKAAQDQINRIDRDIESNTRTMRQLEARRIGRDINGRLVTSVLPAAYYDLEADNAKLGAERRQLVSAIEQLRAAAKETEKQVPTPRYTGVQKLIETEGTPIKMPGDPAATSPAQATQPVDGRAAPTTVPASRPVSPGPAEAR